MNRHGSVILHVLVTGVVVALIAACLLRVTMMSYLVTARSANDVIEKRADEAALALIVSNWSSVSYVCPTGTCYGSISCGSNANMTYYGNCGGSATTPPGNCGCTCTPNAAGVTAGMPTITVSAPGGTSLAGACNLSVLAPDQMSNLQSGSGVFSW